MKIADIVSELRLRYEALNKAERTEIADLFLLLEEDGQAQLQLDMIWDDVRSVLSKNILKEIV